MDLPRGREKEDARYLSLRLVFIWIVLSLEIELGLLIPGICSAAVADDACCRSQGISKHYGCRAFIGFGHSQVAGGNVGEIGQAVGLLGSVQPLVKMDVALAGDGLGGSELDVRMVLFDSQIDLDGSTAFGRNLCPGVQTKTLFFMAVGCGFASMNSINSGSGRTSITTALSASRARSFP